MKRLVICAALCCAAACAASCEKETDTMSVNCTPVVLYADSVGEAIDIVYDYSCEWMGMGKDSLATREEKLAVIRRADMRDEDGDVIPEIPEYEIIAGLLWPHGYGKL